MRRSALRLAVFLSLSGLVIVSGIHPATAQTGTAVRPSSSDRYADHIAEASHRFGIPAIWIRAVMRAESAGDPRAISRAGAIGLMQVMPATWANLRRRHRLGADPFDARDNILAGAAYLRELHDRYGDPVAMLAAYNAGPGRYEASLAGRPLPAETRAYLAALAPTVDGRSYAEPVQIATVDPLAWTHAPLFVARPERKPAAVSAATDRPSAEATDAASPHDLTIVAATPDRLFVARSGNGATP